MLAFAALLSGCGGDGQTPHQLAREFGTQGEAYPLATIHGEDGTYRFVADLNRAQEAPCVDYIVPGEGGGRCYRAASARCGWALEADFAPSDRDAVAFGTAIPAAALIRFGSGRAIRAGKLFKPFGMRFFAALVPRAARHVAPNEIVALDARGRLLGRQHYNDGHGGSGAFDGSHDRAPCDRSRRRTAG